MTLPRTLALALCLLGLGAAQAQDRVDQELDDSLRRTYDGPVRPAEPIPDYAEQEIEKERDQFQVTLRLYAGLQAAMVEDLDIVYREGGTGGATVPLMSRDVRDWDIEEAFAGLPTVELNLGGYFAIRGSAMGVSWREDEHLVSGADPFRFGDTQFGAGDTVESQFDMLTADLQLGAHVVTNRYVRLGLFGGACIGCGPGVSDTAEQVTVSAINRNFKGRSGPGRLYLASPLTVAASAFTGTITDYSPGMFRA